MLCQTVSHVHVLCTCMVIVCQTDLLFCSLPSPVSHMWPLHTQIYLSCSSPSRWASPYTNSFTSHLSPTHIYLYVYYHLTSSSYTLIFFSTDVVLSPSLFHTPLLSTLSSLRLLDPLTSPSTCSNNCCPGSQFWRGLLSGNLPGWLRR